MSGSSGRSGSSDREARRAEALLFVEVRDVDAPVAAIAEVIIIHGEVEFPWIARMRTLFLPASICSTERQSVVGRTAPMQWSSSRATM